MKLHSLWIGEYRVLRDVSLSFSAARTPGVARVRQGARGPGHALDLLVGVNGTGKTTVLRAILDVFRRMARDPGAPDFPFSVTYERMFGELLTVTNVDEQGRGIPGFRVRRGAGGTFEHMDGVKDLVPPLYITYTTGREGVRDDAPDRIDAQLWSTALQGLYWTREQPGHPSGVPGGVAPSAEGHVPVTARDLPLLALCGLLDEAARREGRPQSGGVLDRVLEHVGIARMSAFSLRLRLPPGATVPEVVQKLRRLAPRARVQGTSLLLVFDARTGARDLLSGLNEAVFAKDAAELFRNLSSLARPAQENPGILDGVELFLERTTRDDQDQAPTPDLHRYEWLSDGEQTFLARMCLLSIFGPANALILLDEPEVHFNDYWKRKLVQMLDGALKGHHSHAIVTTHSSIVLTDASHEQILILGRGEEGYTEEAVRPGVRTFASDPSDILVQVFGAEQAAGAKAADDVTELLREYERLARSGLETRELQTLRKRLKEMQEMMAPGYWRYRVAAVLSEKPQNNAPRR
jgi:hypothetical protein